MDNIYVSVVSHNHLDLIESIGCVNKLRKYEDIKIVIKTNTNEIKREFLKECGVFYINEPSYLGFGHNNNIIFDYCKRHLNMKENDYFIVLNPDVSIDKQDIDKLIKNMKTDNVKLSAINLFKNRDFSLYDNSIRKFPTLMTFIKSFLGKGNDSVYDKSQINSPQKIDWAAGSFLTFKVEHYNKLNGFDIKYFMYCEDIDICYRSMIAGECVVYYPDIKALHLAKHENRKMLSKHFLWHILSAIRFLRVKYAKKF